MRATSIARTRDGASYTLDADGNRTAKTDYLAGVTSNYTYDAIYELTQVTQGSNTTESYSGVYPERRRGNKVANPSHSFGTGRTASLGVPSYTVNASNELTATSTATYTYDNNGNTTSKTDSTGTTSYAWDYENRLTSVTLPNSGGTVYFKYGPLGRRIYKSSSSSTSVFAYDGDNLIEEANSSGTVVARYTQTENIDEPLVMLRSGATSFYNADGLGTITSLANTAGSLAQTYTFDSFGNQTASSGSLTNPFRYTGRESDPETGLYYYRARYYDAQIGRFVSEDSLGFAGGGNFYRYVYNSPAGLVDPMGQSAKDVRRIQLACMSCTKSLTDAGLRANTTGALGGHWNDLTTCFTKRWGCKDQAYWDKGCLEPNPLQPYDDNWNFQVVWWPLNNNIVKATDSNPNDPIVYCDPFRNYTWTAPKAQGGVSGGW